MSISFGRAAMVLTLILAEAAYGQAGGKDQVEDAVEAFEKQVNLAKKQFDASVQRSADTTVKRLITLGDNAARNKNEDFAARAFKEVLRIDRSSSQARSFFQQRNKLDAVLSELTLEWHPLVLLAPEGREERVFYECMLGRYQSDRTWIAAVTLVIPDGGNVFNETIHQRAAAGTGDPSSGKLTNYAGTGHLLVPADGVYAFTGPARYIKLNGQELAQIREKPVEVPLKKGVYSIEFAADEKYTGMASILIVDPRTRQRLPIFNSAEEIKKFLAEPAEANGPRRFDISRWSPEAAQPLRIVVPQK